MSEIDNSRLDEIWEEDEELVLDLVDTYKDRQKEILNDLTGAIDRNDNEKVEFFSHSLKGMAGNLGGVAISQICKELEENGKNKSQDEKKALLQEINQKNEAFLKYLSDYPSSKGK